MELRKKVWEHKEKGGEGAPREADKPGEVASGKLEFFFFLIL